MSDELVPVDPSAPIPPTQLASWEETKVSVPAAAQSPLTRPVAAIRRYKWLMLVVVALGSAAGVAATRFVTPQYEVHAQIMISPESPMESRSGPIRSPSLLVADDWIALLKSYKIVDGVVRQLALYVHPADPKTDGELFDNFTLADHYNPGDYTLAIDRAKQHWTLTSEPAGTQVDAGAAIDTVGRPRGFMWLPPKWVFAGSGERKVKFTVSIPRDAAVELRDQLGTQLKLTSNFLYLTLQNRDPHMAAKILNTWVNNFVAEAGTLKKQKLADFAKNLEGQLRTAKNSLDSEESQLQDFRVKTILEPKEGSSPIAAGLRETNDPVMRAFYDKKFEYDDIQRDVQLLRTLVGTIGKDDVPVDALYQVRNVATGAATSQTLHSAITDFHKAESDLGTLRQVLTDSNERVKLAINQVTTLKRVKIPQLTNELLTTLKARALDDSVQIASMSENLQKIPQRTIEEEQHRRNRDIAANLYTDLQNRYGAAQLAEAATTPDVSILDPAIAPLLPTKNTAIKLILMGIAGGFGAAIALAILLDRIDGRLRYPEQATDELGLPIAGTVPQFPKGGLDQNSPEQMYQLVESFRSLRMSVMHASAGRSVSIAISSPSPGEGKSLISANLAMSFADAGLRTVLVDGDTRRGALHDMFGMPASPGLTDYLSGVVGLGEVIRSTAHNSLSVVPCGTRKRRSPELLTSPRLTELVNHLRATYDVVIFDTPPLAAGIDGYAIATATGSLLVVLRVGETARRMAAEKLRLFDNLSVDIVGAVLNGINVNGEYSYYGYVPGYEAEDESEQTAVVKVT
jgi:polysaccharide biosynthesis transport protein